MTKAKTTLASIAAQMQKGFASIEKRIERGFAAVTEDIDELKGDVTALTDRVSAVESKVMGINKRLDEAATRTQDLKLPSRVADLETDIFGQSRHPKHLPL